MHHRLRTITFRLIGILAFFLMVSLASWQQTAQAAPSPNQKTAKAAKGKKATAAHRKKAATSSAKGKRSASGKKKPVADRKKAASAVGGRNASATGKASAKKSTRTVRGKTGSLTGSKTGRLAKAKAVVPARPSFGHLAGLHMVDDPLQLASSVALVVDQDTQQVLLNKNPKAILPIASITKLMTGLIIAESGLPMNTPITITQADVDRRKGSSSRLRVGTKLTRQELLHLALMSSENRAAHALARTYPGGMKAFVAAMNARARLLGMMDTRFVEPTGLSSRNQASARDLSRLVAEAHTLPVLRDLSTSAGTDVAVGRRTLRFANTNRLVHSEEWEIGLQKTGYISEAGRCLVMQANVSGRRIIIVLLDSVGKNSRLADAERVRRWVASLPAPSRHQRHIFAGVGS